MAVGPKVAAPAAAASAAAEAPLFRGASAYVLSAVVALSLVVGALVLDLDALVQAVAVGDCTEVAEEVLAAVVGLDEAEAACGRSAKTVRRGLVKRRRRNLTGVPALRDALQAAAATAATAPIAPILRRVLARSEKQEEQEENTQPASQKAGRKREMRSARSGRASGSGGARPRHRGRGNGRGRP